MCSLLLRNHWACVDCILQGYSILYEVVNRPFLLRPWHWPWRYSIFSEKKYWKLCLANSSKTIGPNFLKCCRHINFNVIWSCTFLIFVTTLTLTLKMYLTVYCKWDETHHYLSTIYWVIAMVQSENYINNAWVHIHIKLITTIRQT